MTINSLEKGLQELNFHVDENQLKQLQAYVDMLMRWNKVYNLTSLKDKDDILRLHILDSLAVAPFVNGQNCLDVGSGGGFPGIPLAIIFPDRRFTLLDAIGKKTRFMQQAAIQIGLPNIRVVQARVESWSPEALFDVIISRAFSSIPNFVSLTSQHLSGQGSIYAMKGRYPEDELEELAPEYQVVAEHKLAIPGLDVERYLIEIQRI